MNDALYINGRFTNTGERVIGVEDRGFQFGDAVYEVFKFVGKRPIFLSDHYRRMEGGLRTLEIRSPWDEARFAGVMRELLERTAFDDGIVYIQITRGESERAHFYPEDLHPTVVAYSRMYRFPDAGRKERGVRLITTSDIRWKHCDVKSVNLLANALAKKHAQRAGADEALLIDDGIVREGASASFFGVREGLLITHPLDEHILPGVVRDRVLTLARTAQIPVEMRPMREDELFDLDEAFTTNTTMGVMPAMSIDGRSMRRGNVVPLLQHLLDEEEVRDASTVELIHSSSAV